MSFVVGIQWLYMIKYPVISSFKRNVSGEIINSGQGCQASPCQQETNNLQLLTVDLITEILINVYSH